MNEIKSGETWRGEEGGRQNERERGGAKEMYNKQSTPSPVALSGVADPPQLCETFPQQREGEPERARVEAVTFRLRGETVRTRVPIRSSHGSAASGNSFSQIIRKEAC